MPVELARHVEAADSLGQNPVGGGHIGSSITVGQITAVECIRRCFDFLVRDCRKVKSGEDSLDRARRALAHADGLTLAEGLDAAVDLPVALDREPLVEVVGVEVAPAEGVVPARHHRVARGDEVRPRQELAHQLRRLADLGVRGDRVVA